ncbi:unnamed protein product [Nippostrongylus brasiliensis]|uniref:Uncharacterized protein n=1 Tax=Nippostrongylus brasiliensis TaxID=27835 RepID=A0A0N4XC65_NIPBR|nr:unnamed protein product [Nippostrongylus brasiliensis]
MPAKIANEEQHREGETQRVGRNETDSEKCATSGGGRSASHLDGRSCRLPSGRETSAARAYEPLPFLHDTSSAILLAIRWLDKWPNDYTIAD